MAERVIVWQDQKFRTRFWAETEGEDKKEKLEEVDHIHQLNPYSMMLGSLGACTAIVLHTYAQYHQLNLDEVELRLHYNRSHKEDCEKCETQQQYRDEIHEDILLRGDLSEAEKQKLMTIAHACPIYRMYQEGIPIRTHLLE